MPTRLLVPPLKANPRIKRLRMTRHLRISPHSRPQDTSPSSCANYETSATAVWQRARDTSATCVVSIWSSELYLVPKLSGIQPRTSLTLISRSPLQVIALRRKRLQVISGTKYFPASNTCPTEQAVTDALVSIAQRSRQTTPSRPVSASPT
jgi:hypothetical protein